VLALLLLGALAGCGGTVTPAPPDSVIDLSDVFAAYDAAGTLVLLHTESGRTLRHDPARAATQFTPASTFKVYNALVALETGVVDPSLDSVQFEWDGEVRRIDGWNEDQSLRMSMQRSTLWVYQEIARRVGEERYHRAFAAEPYGNGDTSCGLETFWLESCLRISAEEQVVFIDRLRRGETAFAPASETAVRELIRLEANDDYVLYGKTGWAARRGAGDVGWLVGWIETDAGAHVYALNLQPAGPSFDMMAARRGVLFEVLDRMGLRPHQPGDPTPTAAPAPDQGGLRRGSPAPDEWLARDKALHFGVSFLLTLSSQYVLVDKARMDEDGALPLATGFSLAVGLGKEAADSRRGHSPAFSWRDLAADALGVALAALVISL
jgi:beta-lactamase class D/uncharacterized protein YfiM (DUF2279 family)